jgi:hypothetical protein
MTKSEHIRQYHPWSGTCDEWPNCSLEQEDKNKSKK